MRGRDNQPPQDFTNQTTLMLNQVRNFVYMMNNPIRRKIFFLNKVAPKRYTQFKDLMYTLNTQVMLGVITEEQMDSQLLAF